MSIAKRKSVRKASVKVEKKQRSTMENSLLGSAASLRAKEIVMKIDSKPKVQYKVGGKIRDSLDSRPALKSFNWFTMDRHS